ncbi:hypothetical protein [Mucilaginibacter myungsuensis]|uniref:Tetratricopeptide repeat protein n=1 Tax=Mucilaginibacter myungsuensis TaxID=649104 RepID=A0A929PUI0_9SPHI|nr:hypothetical protein [Mucilaginibacter myungsuensis]MBE9660783.1 hypothetical protein [Mucilaginibacter myungsuensis]MDN3600828.1 hypothetical protein [Mucilaginibacter myungsuensis]
MEKDNIYQASRYVDGEMDEQERLEFERSLATDAELRAYVEQYQQACVALKSHFAADNDILRLRETLNTLNAEHFKPEAKVVSMRPEVKDSSIRMYTKWASGIAAVLIIGLLVFNPWRKTLYDRYSTATTMSVTERGVGPQTDLEKAAAFYNKKEFTKAEPLLAKTFTADTTNSLAAFYYAVTLIQDKQEDKARSILTSLYKGESAFKYDAAYYMALSYVKQKRKAEAKPWLKLIPKGMANYAKAQELAAKL